MQKNKWNLLIVFLILAISQGVQGCSDKKNVATTWEEWYAEITIYMDKTKDLLGECDELTNSYVMKYGEAEKLTSQLEKDKKIHSSALTAKSDLFKIRNQLKKLVVPQDFAVYNSKIVNIVDSYIEFVDITSRQGDFNQALDKYYLAIIEAVKEIKRAYINHDAPQDYIDTQEALIQEFSEERENSQNLYPLGLHKR